MATAAHLERDEDAARITRGAVNEFIKRQVVGSLGTPGDLLTVQVRPVGSEVYRVNVLVGKDFGAARIPHSFFLTTDGEGKILMASPSIVRTYF